LVLLVASFMFAVTATLTMLVNLKTMEAIKKRGGKGESKERQCLEK
jgi:hypothetical protein